MIIFSRQAVIAAVDALKEAHPYEVVAYTVTKTENI